MTGDNGLLSKASTAKNTQSDAEIEEKLKLAYQDYYLGQHTETGYTFQNAVDKMFGEGVATVTEGNGLYTVSFDNGKSYTFDIATGKAEKVKTLADYGLEIGDTVNYNEGNVNQYEFTTNTTKGMGASASSEKNSQGKYDLTTGTYKTEDLSWKVLGMNSQGQVELISDKPHSIKVTLANEEGYYNGPDELNSLCDALYGKGTGASKARSLNVEDINKLANFDPATATYEYYKYKFDSGVENQYYSKSSDGQTNWSDWNQAPSYMGKTTSFKKIGSNEILSASNQGESEVIRITRYSYSAGTLIENPDTKSLIFPSWKDQWLASSGVDANNAGASWDLYFLDNYSGMRYLTSARCYISSNSNVNWSKAFRPVVTLNSNVKFSGSSSTGWTISE